MHEELLPLFPLSVVLFPRTPLPLHIFEERYKLMIGEAIRDSSEFGIVLAREGEILPIGCTAVVELVAKRYPDGKLDILTRGMRRFRIHSIDEGKEYLRAKVEFFEDTDTETPAAELHNEAVERFTAARHLTGQSVSYEPKWDDPQLSFQLAQILDDVEFLQKLLNLRSESERLKALIEYLPMHVVRWRHTEQMKRKAPQNGKSKFIPTTFT